MTKLEAIAFFMDMDECTYGGSEPIQMAIEALKHELCEDEIMKTIIWFCHVTGGAHDYDFHGYLSEITIKKYRNLGCKVKRIKWKKVILC